MKKYIVRLRPWSYKVPEYNVEDAELPLSSLADEDTIYPPSRCGYFAGPKLILYVCSGVIVAVLNLTRLSDKEYIKQQLNLVILKVERGTLKAFR